MAIPISDIYVRLGEQNAVTEIKFVQGGWFSTGSLADIQGIDPTRVHDKQIAYSTVEGKFYIATKTEQFSTFSSGPPPGVVVTPASLTWAVLPVGFPYTGSAGISGSLVVNGPVSASLFSGSFYGDGSNLTGIGSGILNMTGSFGSSSVDLDTTALVFTGSANGVIPTVSASHVTFELSEELSATGSFSGSFTGSFSGSVVAPGSNGYIIYNSGSYLHGTSSLFFDDVNHRVGLGTDTPTTKLDIHGDALITGSLTVQGIVTAEEFHTEFVSASIVYQSGSTKFGDTSDDVHSFSGSLRVTGSGDHYFTDGNVGIGSTTPTHKLYVEGDTILAKFVSTASDSYAGVAIYNSGNGFLTFGSAGDTQTSPVLSGSRYIVANEGGLIIRTTDQVNGHIRFVNGFTDENMRITPAGDVGIGTTTPAEKLSIEGSISASGDFYLDGALYDVNNEPGSTGQILSSTATGVDWVDPTGISVQAQQVFASVKNLSGGILYKGTPVHAVSGSSSGNINPVIAASASDASTMPATFVLNEDLADEEEGLAIAVGFIANVNTSAFEVGDVVYVGESGGYTNVKPSGSGNLIQNLGVVTKKHASNGAGYVYGSGRSNDVPNLPVGKIWVGSTEYSVTSSLVHLDETNGRMGIGTDAPQSLLHISSGTSGDAILIIESDTDNSEEEDNPSILLKQDGGNVTSALGIVGSAGEIYSNSLQNAVYLNANGAGMALQFGTTASTTTTSKMTIEPGGNVGLGITDPTAPLHVYNSNGESGGTTLLLLQNASTGDLGTQKSFVDFSLTDTNDNETPQVRIGAEVGKNASADSQVDEGAGAFVVYTNNPDTGGGEAGASLSERFRVDYKGNVGIGNTAPPVKFVVNNGVVRTSTNKTYSSFVHTNDTDDYRVGLATAIKGGATSADRYVSLEGSSYRVSTNAFTNEFDLVLNPIAGNVGIGTDQPSGTLHVSGTLRVDDRVALPLYGTGDLVGSDITYALGVDVNGNVLEIPQNTGANADVDTGTEVVDSFASGSVRAAFTNYYVLSGSNMRAGQLMSIWDDSGNIEYTDVSTNSLGDTSGVLMFASVNGGDIEIKTTVDTDNWSVKVNTTLL